MVVPGPCKLEHMICQMGAKFQHLFMQCPVTLQGAATSYCIISRESMCQLPQGHGMYLYEKRYELTCRLPFWDNSGTKMATARTLTPLVTQALYSSTQMGLTDVNAHEESSKNQCDPQLEGCRSCNTHGYVSG